MALNIDFEYDSKKDGFVYCIKDKETDTELATLPDAFKSPREAMRACLHRLNSQGGRLRKRKKSYAKQVAVA